MNFLIKNIIKFPIHYLYTGEKYLTDCSKNLAIDYTDKTLPSYINRETIICMFDGKLKHGGLADRLRGIISMYYYSKLHNLDFKIYHIYPFELSVFLCPNRYDWRIDRSELCFNPSISKPLFVASADYFLENSLTKRFLKKNIRNYKQYHVYPSIKIGDKVFKECFHELFIPSPLLKDSIKRILYDINDKFITISFRFVELLGDFHDTIKHTLPDNKKEILIQKCLLAISKIRKEAPEHNKVVITSDSKTFLHRAKSLPNVYLIPGELGHVDYKENLNIHLKTFTDFFIISHAEKSYMVRTKEMYKSGFAQRACMVNNTPFEEYIIG